MTTYMVGSTTNKNGVTCMVQWTDSSLAWNSDYVTKAKAKLDDGTFPADATSLMIEYATRSRFAVFS